MEVALSLTALPNLHPALVHFPVALLLTALGFDVACLAFRRHRWFDWAALSLYLLGTVSAGATYLSGRQAANSIRGLSGPVETAVWDHGDSALLMLAAFIVVGGIRLTASWRERTAPRVRLTPLRVFGLAAALVAQGLLFWTADQGGALVYRHGVAVARPVPDAPLTTATTMSQAAVPPEIPSR
ncbi:MAG TPA: hypothetical protein PKJ99_03790 [Thermoanaerobaculales bacterium]|nr:hypothetical protein [Thermoanaerobaculales bacterium]HPA79999.1 hypothetical protein [Thermoanaerobaculales bacterium]HQL31075.1 hypothetical protein [Thermoanaerobaculales bacterium]HQP44613.1 hypothetical protein [Thermoanaerobaculales bacterium]